jgi:hypothetical protein
MSVRPLPDATYVRACLDYDPMTGELFWRTRPVEHFSDMSYRNRWNTRYAGKVAGFKHHRGYHLVLIGAVKFMAHRVAWLMERGEPVPNEIDHIDGDRSNNRISNLRAATRSENLSNMRAKNSNCQTKGVWFDASRGKFQAHITHRYKSYKLGRFDTLEEAVAARREAAERLHGEFARHG